ncbi:methyl-accepting chemotaxis protein [Sphingosinicella sp. BN140058]|uniref:methyl-accepting chemotaxis protein n=1 Tax=Sphingosinicella sp. BN140058 TaxID=1892855 RepID=UPI0013EB1B2E|nr:methyl-accepting chemotaxis protein [Sphingosinicella sp. BN140058]
MIDFSVYVGLRVCSDFVYTPVSRGRSIAGLTRRCRNAQGDSYMEWFQVVAPIRQKTFVAFGTMIAFIAVVGSVASLGGPLVGAAATLIAAGAAALLAARFRRAICDPYVSTVVRMEALAAGDLSSPIEFTHYKDCVGRMTKAMFTFQETALAQQRSSAEQSHLVETLSAHLETLAAGDLSRRITEEFPDHYAQLKDSYNQAVSALSDLVGAVRESAETINAGSGEIAHASEDLSRRTEQQAASIEETAAAMTEITATVQNSATGANEVNKRVLATQADAQESSKVVSAAVAAMAAIEQSSQEITKIITVIDKIAFQTNLLALNASVEAAHAGEAGRAFAVVANEVRALAQRSADAAQEIGTLISNSSRQVEGGVALVSEAGQALDRIIGSIDEVSGLVGQITMAADQQSSALAQVSTAVVDMDKVTQQNAAMVEETSAAARNLASEVSALAARTSQFIVASDGARPTRSAEVHSWRRAA